MIAPFLVAAGGCGWTAGDGEPHHEHAEHEEGEAGPGEVVLGEDARRDLRITTVAARVGSAGEPAIAQGDLMVDEGRYAAVGSPVSGRVRRVLRGPGDAVDASEVLAEVESAELGRARAELAAARARAGALQGTVQRKRGLGPDVVSQAELALAEVDLAVADADVAAAEAALVAYGAGTSASGGATLGLRAPVAGVVLWRDARVGDLVDTEHTLFRVADLSQLWLEVHASERDALRVVTGAVAEVRFAAVPNRLFEGRVDLVGLEVDPSSRTVPIRVVVANPDGLLLPGMSATALLPLAADPGVVSVPANALQRLDEDWVVFVPRDADRFEIREVGRGRDAGSEVEVLSGLAPGETVVVDGSFLLKAEAGKQKGGAEDAHGH